MDWKIGRYWEVIEFLIVQSRFLDIEREVKRRVIYLKHGILFVNMSCHNVKFFSIRTPQNELIFFSPRLTHYV